VVEFGACVCVPVLPALDEGGRLWLPVEGR
jgi:hypothetical protein